MKLATDRAIDLMFWWQAAFRTIYPSAVYTGSDPLDRRALATLADMAPDQTLLAMENWLLGGGTPTVASFVAGVSARPMDWLEPSVTVAAAEVACLAPERGVELRPRQLALLPALERALWRVQDYRNAFDETVKEQLPEAEGQLAALVAEFERMAV